MPGPARRRHRCARARATARRRESRAEQAFYFLHYCRSGVTEQQASQEEQGLHQSKPVSAIHVQSRRGLPRRRRRPPPTSAARIPATPWLHHRRRRCHRCRKRRVPRPRRVPSHPRPSSRCRCPLASACAASGVMANFGTARSLRKGQMMPQEWCNTTSITRTLIGGSTSGLPPNVCACRGPPSKARLASANANWTLQWSHTVVRSSAMPTRPRRANSTRRHSVSTRRRHA